MALKTDQIFYLKYFLPCIALILSYVVFGQYYTTALTENDLVNITGQVVSIKKDKYKHYKYTDDRITIKLHNLNEPLYFFDNRADLFSIIMSNVQIGDLLIISHRTKLQSRIGSGSEFKIMKVQKGRTVLYSFDSAKQTFSHVGGFTVFAAIGLWLLYFYFRHKIRQAKGST